MIDRQPIDRVIGQIFLNATARLPFVPEGLLAVYRQSPSVSCREHPDRPSGSYAESVRCGRAPPDWEVPYKKLPVFARGYPPFGELLKQRKIIIRGGHGSPSQKQRIGEVPHIKVSDLRAVLMNINPTNRIPCSVAERFWGGKFSDLRAFDLVRPERTPEYIGDFCVLMPSQKNVLMTNEIIVIRPGVGVPFDPFYLIWAMKLKIVRDQWKRVVFIQANREDVGKRFYEIESPVPPDAKTASRVSAPFRDYYQTLASARTELQTYIGASKAHHFFVSAAEALALEDVVAAGDNAGLVD